jgi:hypothetical protein
MRLDQGQTGTCEGNAWTNCLIAGPVTHPTFPDFSDSQAAEAFARKLYVDATGDATLQLGATTRSILRTLLGRGQIGAYHRCASVDEIVQTLLTVGPVCIGTPWFNSMDSPYVGEDGHTYVYVDEGSGIRGYHETCLTAVDLAPETGQAFVRDENSWGHSFGDNGTFRILLDDLHVLYLGDAYTVTEATF